MVPVVKKPSFKAEDISPLKNAGNMMTTTADSIKQPILSQTAFTEKKDELILKEKSSDEMSTRSSKTKEEAQKDSIIKPVTISATAAAPPPPVEIHKVAAPLHQTTAFH